MKTNYKATLQKLSQVIDDSLVLLKLSDINQQKDISLNIPVTSLLDQCLELCEQHHTYIQEPIRIIHHFGLPLNSPLLPSLATLANTQVIKDIHLQNTINSQTLVAKKIDPENQVHSTPIEDECWIQVLLSELRQIQFSSNKIGRRLLVCNNYCQPQFNNLKNLSDFFAELTLQFDTQELVVVTDPLESYQVYSTLAQSDQHIFNFEEYCQYTVDFIQKHPELTIIRHEDLIATPEKVLQEICTLLDLPFNEDFEVLKQVFSDGSI